MLLLCYFHQDNYQIKNNKETRDTLYRLSAKAKTSHSLRGKHKQILLIEPSIDEYQDHDKDP